MVPGKLINVEWLYLELKVAQTMLMSLMRANHRSETDNQINAQHGGYENVTEYIPIGTPSAATLRELDELEPSEVFGDRALMFYPLLIHLF